MKETQMDTTATAPRKTSPVAIVATLIVGVLIGGGVMWFLRGSPADVTAEVTAKQFCGLSAGTSLLEVGAWTKAAQATADDWPAVVAEIGARCPAWRDQVVAKSGELSP